MAASSKQPWEITDFSGGITDNVFSGEMNTAFAMDNFFITPDKKLLSRPGSTLDDAAHSPLPAGNLRIGALINYARNDKLFAQAARNFYYRSGSGTGVWSTLTGPSGNAVLTAQTTSNFISYSEWNKQIFVVSDSFANPMKILKDSGGTYRARNVGLPKLASDPVVTVGAASTKNYVYAFVMSYTYTAQTQTFQELGPTRWVTVANSSEPSVSTNAISVIPVLTNAGNNNYDTANIHVDIYRTINNGTNFYKIGSVVNGTTTFNDTFSDATIQTNLQLYTNDGTLDYYPAPQAKFLHICGNIGFYGYTNDVDGEHPYRLHQSTPGNPGFCPQITYVEVEDEVKGIGSVKALPILLCKRYVYRIDGTYDSKGRGGMNPQRISASAGCISAASCVEAEGWLFWAGLDGFYATDGYQVMKISDHLNTRYAAMVADSQNTMRIQGKFDEVNRRVFWCVALDSTNLENDSIFSLDLRYGVKPNSTFTTGSGTSFRPTALEIFNGYFYRGDNNGFVFKHDPSVLTDPKVDTGATATAWAEETIIWTLTSNQFNFGGSFFRKFVSRILLQAGNAGNTTIQVTAVNDQGRKSRDLKIIRWRRNVTWGDESFVWGNADCIWDAEGLIEQWRRFPAGGLRLSYLQLTITNGLGVIATSADEGVCVLNKGAKTAVLAGGWPSKSVDYYLKLSADNYTRLFQVTAINGSLDTLTLLDTGGNLPASGSYDWELVGYAKGEPLNLLGFNLHWDSVDQSQGTYHAGDDGAN
jgi:hypothetical protein